MTYAQVIDMLQANENEKGKKHWENMTPPSSNLKSFGIGLTVLRNLAKKIGKNRTLSKELWESDYYDAKVISLLIDDPKQITREQAEQQVENLEGGYLAHVFSSCDASLAKTPFVADLAVEWMNSDDAMRNRCSYGLVYELSKSKKKSAPDDAYFLDCIRKIQDTYQSVENLLLVSMGGALMGIGKRNAIVSVVPYSLIMLPK